MIRSAIKFAEDCGRAGAAWEGDVEEKIRHGLEMNAVTPSCEEQQDIVEAWMRGSDEAASSG